MREIKFRAYRNDVGMVAVTGINFDTNWADTAWRREDGKTDFPNMDPSAPYKYGQEMPIGDDCILLQYTGFKDRNDMEIWEGDIIEWGKGIFDLDENIFEVQYCHWGFAIRNCKSNKTYPMVGPMPNDDVELGITDPRTITVIGNIHEDPELVGSK